MLMCFAVFLVLQLGSVALIMLSFSFWQGVIATFPAVAPAVRNRCFSCTTLMVFHWEAMGVQEDKADVICGEEWTTNPLVKLP